MNKMILLLAALVWTLSAACQVDGTIEKEVSVQPDSMKIYGSVLRPQKAFTGDAVLIIAGSGPTDRDGNQPTMRTNAYKQVADSLALHGIASLRYDKRFIGKSTGAVREENLRFEDNVLVAQAFFELLQKESGVKRVFIAGHSEGSTVGMLLAERVKAAGYISIAGPGFAADSLLRKQLSAVPEALKTEAYQAMDSLKAGHTVHKINPALMGLLRPGIQPYMTSWFKQEPQQIVARLKMPVLVVQGTTDIQVGMENSTALSAACKDCKVAIIEGMNHVLKTAPADRGANIATYSKPELPLAPGLVDALVKFIRKK